MTDQRDDQALLAVRRTRAMRELRKCLRSIRDHKADEHPEVAYDEYAYKRMVEIFNGAAAAGLEEAARIMRQKVDGA